MANIIGSWASFCGIVISMPKTILFNIRVLPLKQALKLPFFVWYKVRVLCVKRGIVQLPGQIKPFMIRFGKGGTRQVIENRKSLIYIGGGSLIFKGAAGFAAGFSLDCSGNLTFGPHFSTNKNSFISCSREITFGERVMLGDNVVIRDSDGHTVYKDGKAKRSQKPITIGNHAWIASHSHILKGSHIPDDSIVAYRSLVTKQFYTPNSLIAGCPAKEVQTGISWGRFNINEELENNE